MMVNAACKIQLHLIEEQKVLSVLGITFTWPIVDSDEAWGQKKAVTGCVWPGFLLDWYKAPLLLSEKCVFGA